VSANDYHFVTRWRIQGTCGEIADVLGDPLSFARWWPSVYLEVDEIRPADAHGLGRVVALRTTGWLPYTLRFETEVVDSRYPHGYTIVAHGDFEGRGEWTFEQDGAVVDVTYDWRLRAEKPLIKKLTPLLRPLFAANHRWAMAQGERSLRLELARRRLASDEARARVPAPPGPVTYAGAALLVGVAAAGASLSYLVFSAHRGSRSRRSSDER
jgi:Polyketide cyclase / dehydrase and lipid transport